ncbi:MAG TPA: hypothetical protein VII76_01295 [Acidimicrobiales bacterium]
MSVVDAVPANTTQPRTIPTSEVGMKVAVRNRYLGTWSAGFEVVALHLDGYSIRRTSDGAVLPEVIPFSDVREPWGPPTDGMS